MLRTNPNRFHEIQFVELIVREIVPLTFGECPEVRTFPAFLDQKGEFSNGMHSKNEDGNTRDVQSYRFQK